MVILKKCKIHHRAFLLTLLCIILLFSLVDYMGFGYYVLLLALPILFHKLPYKYFDSNFWLLLIWGFWYGFAVIIFKGSISYGVSLQYFINFPIMYIYGRFLANNLSKDKLLDMLALSIFAFSIIAVLSVFKDINQNGFFAIGLDRNIPLIGLNNEDEVTVATGVSTRLLPAIVLIGLLMFHTQNKYSIIRRYMILYGCIAFFCAIRIQSRTSVILVGLVLLIGLIRNLNSKNTKKIFISLATLLIIICVVIYIIFNYSEELMIINRFENESNTDGGGRMELLCKVVQMLPDYPFGGMFLNKNIRYAHNLWIDCARVAGLIPMFILILLTVLYIKKLIFINKRYKNNSDKRQFGLIGQVFNLVTISFFIGFLAEPILEGISMFACLFILYWGMLSGCSENRYLLLD